MIYHASPNSTHTIAAALAEAGPGDTIYLHEGIFNESISTQNGAIQGGSSRRTKLTIKAYQDDRVIIQPNDIRCVTLIGSAASYIEFEGIEFDGANCSIECIKFTYTGAPQTNVSTHITMRNCKIYNSPSQGVLTTGIHGGWHRFIHCQFFDNGTPVTNLQHGLYLSNSYNLVSKCDVWNSTAYGVHIYDDSAEPAANFNRVEYCRIWSNTTRAGILLSSGTGNSAFRNTCWNNDYGIYVFGNSINAKVEENQLLGNITGTTVEGVGAVGTYYNGNQPT